MIIHIRRRQYDHGHREDDRSFTLFLYSFVHTFPEAIHSDQQGSGGFMAGLDQTSKTRFRFSYRSSGSIGLSEDR